MSTLFAWPWRRRRMSTRALVAVTVTFLAAALFCGVQLLLAQHDADAFHAAVFCSQPPQPSCVGDVPVTVLSTRATSGRSAHYFITVQASSGTPTEVEVADDNGRWTNPSAGAQMDAVYWRGKIVVLKGPFTSDIKTTDNPVSRADAWRLYGIAAWITALIATIVLVVRLLSGSSSVSSSGGVGPGPGYVPTYEFSHGDADQPPT